MSKIVLLIVVGLGIITGAGLYLLVTDWRPIKSVPTDTPSETPSIPNPDEVISECTAEAKLCPDGSSVGRTGPNCEFAACPIVPATASRGEVSAKLGQSVTVGEVTITPTSVVSDSRCPVGVACIWAGTVEVQTTLRTVVEEAEQTLTLGQPATFGMYTVTLTAVAPEKTSDSVPTAAYQFTFTITPTS